LPGRCFLRKGIARGKGDLRPGSLRKL
jgi:hypothetical protein